MLVKALLDGLAGAGQPIETSSEFDIPTFANRVGLTPVKGTNHLPPAVFDEEVLRRRDREKLAEMIKRRNGNVGQ